MVALVVDDDPAIRAFVQAILLAEDIETLDAEDGEQAYEIVSSIDGDLDLIVTDLQMPGGGGLRFAERVKQNFGSVPVVLMSGYPPPETDFVFVQKPFSWVAMQSVVRRVLRARTRVA